VVLAEEMIGERPLSGKARYLDMSVDRCGRCSYTRHHLAMHEAKRVYCLLLMLILHLS
jgi:hypothetical protein